MSTENMNSLNTILGKRDRQENPKTRRKQKEVGPSKPCSAVNGDDSSNRSLSGTLRVPRASKQLVIRAAQRRFDVAGNNLDVLTAKGMTLRARQRIGDARSIRATKCEYHRRYFLGCIF